MSELDWEEDFEHENGDYMGTCFECKEQFRGHKRRVRCKKCSGNGIWEPIIVGMGGVGLNKDHNQRPPITVEQWMNSEEPIENGEYLCKFDSPLKSIGWVFKICTYSAKAFYCDGVFVEPNYYTKLNKFWLTTLTDILEGPKQGGKQ